MAAATQAEAIQRLEQDNRELRDRLAEKDRHYAALVERMAAPLPVLGKVMVPTSPEAAAITGAKAEYVTRMAQDFVDHGGMSPDAAQAEALRLAQEAEGRMF